MDKTQTTTVVIPCYNAGKVLSNTLDALLDQTLLPDEILIVDDGSTDNTLEVAERYGAIVRCISQKNQGAAVARHTGALNAKGDIVFFVDAGDTSPREKIATLKHALESCPEAICAFGECWNKSKSIPDKTRFTQSAMDGKLTEVEDPFRVILRESWPIVSAMNIAVRKEFAIKGSDIGSFYRAGNDYAMQLHLASFGKFVHTAKITSEFEILDQGLTSNFGIDQQMSYSLLASVEFYQSHPNKKDYRDTFKKRISYYWPSITYFMWSNPNKTLRNQVIKAGLKNANLVDSVKAFYWTLRKEHESGQHIKNPILRYLTKRLSHAL